jgi:hypothetical protein
VLGRWTRPVAAMSMFEHDRLLLDSTDALIAVVVQLSGNGLRRSGTMVCRTVLAMTS